MFRIALSESLDEKRKNVKLIKEQTSLLTERIGLPKSEEATKVVKDAVKEKSNIGKNLVKVGTALIIIPDPITSAAGVPIAAVGKVLDSRQGASIAETLREFDQTIKVLRRATSEI